jgi:hypothetical protein
VVDRSAGAGGWWLRVSASSVRRGKTVTFLTTFGWFLAGLGGAFFPFGVARWWFSAFFESCFSNSTGFSTVLSAMKCCDWLFELGEREICLDWA